MPSFGNHHNNYWFSQESSMDAKMSGLNYDKKGICTSYISSYIVSSYLPTRYLLIIKRKQ